MCCVHVVPLLGYEQMKISEEQSRSAAHLAMVSSLEMESNGILGAPVVKEVMCLGSEELRVSAVDVMMSFHACKESEVFPVVMVGMMYEAHHCALEGESF